MTMVLAKIKGISEWDARNHVRVEGMEDAEARPCSKCGVRPRVVSSWCRECKNEANREAWARRKAAGLVTLKGGRKPKIGVWQCGPVRYDWSGETGVLACSACSWAVMVFEGTGIGEKAQSHLFHAHNLLTHRRIPIPERVAEAA